MLALVLFLVVVGAADAGREAPCALRGAEIRGRIVSVGENHYRVDPVLYDRVVHHLESWIGCGRLVPFFRDHVPVGLRLMGLLSDSIYQQAGFREKDVVKTVNGDDLSSPEKAFELYDAVNEAERVEVVIERDGKPLTLVFEIPRHAGAH